MERFLLYKFFFLMNINIKNRFMGGVFAGVVLVQSKITTRTPLQKADPFKK